MFARFWTAELSRWPHLVKAAGNLGYHGPNASVIRNWNTVELGATALFRPKTALYSGNLGYGHHLPSFLAVCRDLRSQGFEITVRGDGPGIAQLPDWVRTAPPAVDPAEMIRSYWEAEVHLIAGHPSLGDAVFPSKFWNAHATGRTVLASGFDAAMAAELEAARSCDPRAHLRQWTQFLVSLVEGRPVLGRT
jgi:hypothetical protein